MQELPRGLWRDVEVIRRAQRDQAEELRRIADALERIARVLEVNREEEGDRG